MPKALSLKKVQSTGPPKNQKAITQFFKNTTSTVSQKPQISADNIIPNHDEKATSKRKASSPVLVDVIDLLDEPMVAAKKEINSPKKLKTGTCNGSFVQSESLLCKSPSRGENVFSILMSAKKESLKIVSPTKKIPKLDILESIKKNPFKTKVEETQSKSPNKENELSLGTSPRKGIKKLNSNSPHKSVSKKDHTESLKGNEEEILKNVVKGNEISRPQLTPVYVDNKTDHLKYDQAKSCSKTLVFDVGPHKSPVKRSPKKDPLITEAHNHEIRKTPKKSPLIKFHCSPISKQQTPDKSFQVLLSPSKSGSTSTIRALEFDQEVGDAFGDEWDMKEFEEDCVEDLDLSTMQRCEILSVKNIDCRVELKLKNSSGHKGTCFVEGVWLDTPLSPGDTVSVIATRDSAGQYYVGNSSGLFVLRPDHLMSSTSVVAGVFCRRKAVLQERWKGIDSANTAMTIGILIHELVQKALTQNIFSLARLRLETDMIIKESMQMLYDAGLSEDETRANMQNYVNPLAEFMQKYVANTGDKQTPKGKNNWSGHVDKVLDIEENICCPPLGIKGKIDATLEVTIHDRKGYQKAVVPLELKSGKASVSAEHRGQLVLYGMMLSLQRNEDPTETVQKGLLLYLKERVDLREVSCGYPERRDLIMLRNQLVQYLAQGPEEVDPEQLLDIEDASILLQQRLPEPVNHHNACTKCPYLTLCSLHLWHTDGPSVSETHPLSKLRDEAMGHLTATHIKYFLHWTALLKMEERGQMMTSPLHALWTDSVEKREKRGTCASHLKLRSVKQSGDRYLHHFERQTTEKGSNNTKLPSGPQEGEFSIVSIKNRPWIAAGVVSLSTQKEINILLERDLSRRLNKDTRYHIDTYESYATTVQNLTNLGVLLEDSERAERLRKLIIDKTPPEFEKKLPRDVGRLGAKLMRSLNIEQQRAVLKAVTAKDYALLQGLPGTGKTQTICVLIQMLVGLKQRVLVTAHTHSAVDTVLCRLPDTLKIMRLGSSARMAPALSKRSEQALISSCETLDQLSRVYDSMEVVGVTCLGAAHAMLSKTVFDVCIVDEATQVLQCTVLRPLFAAKRFVLVGDPEQLPPVVRSRAARRLGMEESLFHRLMREDATSTLQLQYRMNESLANVANKVAYRNRLKCADEKVAQAKLNVSPQKLSLLSGSLWLHTACSPDPENAAVFIDLASTISIGGDSKKSCANEDEASLVIALVEALIEVGVGNHDIGVIAPYRDQVSLLRRAVVTYSVEVSTVDQFQGRDKSVIIYSCTKRDGDDRKVKEGEVLNDQRRLAVSVTRAKHKLIVVGNSSALKKYAPIRGLIDACKVIQLKQSLIVDLRNKYKNVVS